jgi:hypothetical protein
MPSGLPYMWSRRSGEFLRVGKQDHPAKELLRRPADGAFNFTYAPEFRNLLSDDPTDPTDPTRNWQEETDVNFSLAASYRFIANWSAGFEFVNERP